MNECVLSFNKSVSNEGHLQECCCSGFENESIMSFIHYLIHLL